MFTPEELQAIREKHGITPVSSSATPTGTADRASRFATAWDTPTPTPPEEGGIKGFVKSIVSAPATMLARPFQAAQSAGQILGKNTDELSKIDQQASDTNLKLVKLMNEKKARGEDVSHIEKTLHDVMSTPTPSSREIARQNNYEPSHGGVVAPAPKNMADVKKDVGRGMETIALGMGPVSGGAAFGAGNALEQGNDLFSIPTAVETAVGMIGGKTLDIVGKPIFNALGKVVTKITPELIQDIASRGAKAITDFAKTHNILPEQVSHVINEGAKVIEEKANVPFTKSKEVASRVMFGTPEKQDAKALEISVQDTMPLANKDVRTSSLRGTLPTSGNGTGGVTREGILGKSTIKPTEEDTIRGQVAHEYIKGEKDPIVKIQKINQGIVDSSNKVDEFLDQNAAPANFEDMRGYIEHVNKPDINLQKDPVAFENYNRANENALNTLYDTMKSTAEQTDDFGPMTSAKSIREARIKIDQQIAEELGKETFGSPQYKGIKAAEISVRNTLNRMSEDMLRYPGQLEKLNKMIEFVNESKNRGIDVNLEDPDVVAELEKQFKLSKTPQSESAAQSLADQHKRMSYLYDARDNMIDKYQASVGKNKLQEAIKNNPIYKATVDTVKKSIPFGIGHNL